ncbi:four helix bundle protein [Flavobacterium caeni]|uniref:Four helix bundle protein n=1 Tax=Flavobacterium caeni TaxID=490189 RepID=A0A1G5JDB4_9FLAO|nr:four helix bundle protein [Flavobacterium caeni]SCY86356.1 four helix bundle protein [Flavobacterium caeni]
MKKFNSFEEIVAWQKARELNKQIYLLTDQNNGFNKDFDLKRQIRRAVVSVSSNIAEGFERNTDNEFCYFLFVAKASSGEVRSQLYLAYDLGYISDDDFRIHIKNVTDVSRLIAGLIKFLSKAQAKSPSDFCH